MELNEATKLAIATACGVAASRFLELFPQFKELDTKNKVLISAATTCSFGVAVALALPFIGMIPMPMDAVGWGTLVFNGAYRAYLAGHFAHDIAKKTTQE